MNSRTIVAQSTPVGKGAIAIVRMSGKDAEELLMKCFRPYSGAKKLRAAQLTLGTVDAGGISDRAMAVMFRAPKSYTGEDLAEIHLHGSQEIASRVIKHLIKLGARPAEHGEFTRRAFMSGKVSLSEAEAVGDLINAKSASEINAAYSALKGKTAEELRSLYEGLIDVVSSFDAALDYPEEDVEEMLLSEAQQKLVLLKKQTEDLIRSYESGHKIRDGIRVVLSGEPNAGKSSLLNALIGKDRAIVTEVPGTTRDTIEESFEYRGLLFTLIDTAGLHETGDTVEREGIRRTEEEIKTSDIAVVLAPGGEQMPAVAARNILPVCSKCDIKRNDNMLCISSRTGEGIAELKEKLFELAGVPDIAGGGAVITGERQYALMCECGKCLDEALAEIASGCLADIALVGIKGALAAVGKITGANATEDVLDAVFSKFCVGK